ncbi:golgin family A protein [Thalictrum thalictroides]|uniref:Golgin family A protein n=1 Tax=Thalictrum thalictroides TaxID=46969 RepID=A0A7J6VN45_THATH|nr:golgin family A protein [Thalictrum thalictroides]
MEGVGARLGRSSTRYGPTTVFTGPVRKWKKNWVHVSSSSSQNHHNSNNSNGNNNGGSHLLLFKWSPISNSNNNGNANGGGGDKNLSKDGNSSLEPPRKKFKYIPVWVKNSFFFFLVFNLLNIDFNFDLIDGFLFDSYFVVGILGI